MTRTVTICAYNRPIYLDQVIGSLRRALSLASWRPDKIVVGVDPGGQWQNDVVNIAAQAPAPVEVIVWPEHLGVSEAPRRLLQYVFSELESAFNLHLEDDTVISPDALNLVDWYERNLDAFWARGLLCLTLHSPSSTHENKDVVYRRSDFGVWGWAMDFFRWRGYLSQWWNHRRYEPLGWDYSATDMLHRCNLQVAAPALSRVCNIGREGGTFQTPAGYDLDFAGKTWARSEDATADFKIRDEDL
jgi:hypothetical protein